jgi:iron(III) transport system substrate-binding protein
VLRLPSDRKRRQPLLRTLAAASIFALAAVIIACGGRNEAESENPTPEPEAESATESASGNLVVYSGREEELIGPIIEQFEKATGIDVKVKYGSNSGLIGTIFEEGGNSPADLFLGSDPGALGVLSEQFVQLPDEILERVGTPFRSGEGTWIGLSGRARVVVYNTDKLSEADLPDSIFDFTEPEWKGRIGWAPTNGSFQAMVTAMRLTAGEDRTRDWLETIKENGAKEYPKNTPIVQAVADGEIDVGFVNHYYLYRFLAEHGDSFSARNYHLSGGDPGATVLVAGIGILDSSDNVPAARAFIDFLLSQQAQQYFTDETYEYPLIEGVQAQVGLKPLVSIEVPDLDLSRLSDLEGTLDLLREAGVIP